MAHKNPKLGKEGEYPPRETLMGQSCPPYPLYRIGLDDGYYVVHNTAVGGDWRAALQAVRDELVVPPVYSRKSRKDEANGPEGDSASG